MNQTKWVIAYLLSTILIALLAVRVHGLNEAIENISAKHGQIVMVKDYQQIIRVPKNMVINFVKDSRYKHDDGNDVYVIALYSE